MCVGMVVRTHTKMTTSHSYQFANGVIGGSCDGSSSVGSSGTMRTLMVKGESRVSGIIMLSFFTQLFVLCAAWLGEVGGGDALIEDARPQNLFCFREYL